MDTLKTYQTEDNEVDAEIEKIINLNNNIETFNKTTNVIYEFIKLRNNYLKYKNFDKRTLRFIIKYIKECYEIFDIDYEEVKYIISILKNENKNITLTIRSDEKKNNIENNPLNDEKVTIEEIIDNNIIDHNNLSNNESIIINKESIIYDDYDQNEEKKNEEKIIYDKINEVFLDENENSKNNEEEIDLSSVDLRIKNMNDKKIIDIKEDYVREFSNKKEITKVVNSNYITQNNLTIEDEIINLKNEIKAITSTKNNRLNKIILISSFCKENNIKFSGNEIFGLKNSKDDYIFSDKDLNQLYEEIILYNNRNKKILDKVSNECLLYLVEYGLCYIDKNFTGLTDELLKDNEIVETSINMVDKIENRFGISWTIIKLFLKVGVYNIKKRKSSYNNNTKITN